MDGGGAMEGLKRRKLSLEGVMRTGRMNFEGVMGIEISSLEGVMEMVVGKLRRWEEIDDGGESDAARGWWR
jgi:hypothetical protein